MNPAFSVVVFTTAAGAGQGLVVALALAALAHVPLAPASLRAGLAVAIVLLVVGLAASFLHLGRPARVVNMVELGKALAQRIIPELASADPPAPDQAS